MCCVFHNLLRYRQYITRSHRRDRPLPPSTSTLVIGAGVHGLSTAWHLAAEGDDVLVVDKTDVAAGASGIACGVVRNNYFQPAMQELMAACVEVWESEPEAFHYHGSGYIALGPPAQEEDLIEVHERQQRIGYPSELIVGEQEVAAHMRSLYPDWRAPGLTVCLHERAGGYAFNRESMLGLADKARAAGARIETGVEVTGFEFDGSGAVTSVHTSAGAIDGRAGRGRRRSVDRVAVGDARPSRPPRRAPARRHGRTRTCRCGPTGISRRARSTSTRPCSSPPTASSSPVLHVDSDQPLRDDAGRLITTEPWGVYFKPDRTTVQGGAQPLTVGPEFEVDPYPTGSVEPGFPDMWSAALSHCLERFENSREKFRQVRSGGVGAFTVDNFPVLDYMRPNVFVAADSNHGYKMIAVGREVARVLQGEHSSLLHPFRYERFQTGDLHPVSHSPYPWS